MERLIIDLFILLLIGSGIYTLLILPRNRDLKKRTELVQTLSPGTEVLTFGGLIGTVQEINRDTGIVRLRVAEGMELEVLASAITMEFDREKMAEEAQKVLKAGRN
ncbi:MAG: preprotein translocase subunit YajC [Chloroflexi bacterium]|nr:preprotein translocase subunit YajC [Chloroflexota bacterium]